MKVKMGRLSKLQPLIPIAVFIAVWQALSNSGVVNETLFPPPTKVFFSFIELWQSGELFTHINSSIWRVILSLIIGSIFGAIIGLITGRVRIADKSLSPLLQVFRSFPPVAIIPLIIVWLGIGEQAKIFSISFAIFFPVWVNAHIGASRIQEHYLRAAHLLADSVYKKWVKVILPASLPFIIAGIRTGIAIAFIMVFVSELAGASSGIGYLISVSHLAYRIDKMIAGLILLGFFGALADFVFVTVFRRLFPWTDKV